MPRKKADTQPDQPSFRYQGFDNPNGTVVPDDVFDVLMPNLSEAELRVLLYIIRRTFGFKKNSDAISLTQMVQGITTQGGRVLDSGTGLSRRGVMRGCAGLVEKGVITVEKRLSPQGDNEINTYQLRFRNGAVAADIQDGGVGNEMPYRREAGAPRVGNHVPPQQTEIQQTDIDHSNIRNVSDEIRETSADDGGTGKRPPTGSGSHPEAPRRVVRGRRRSSAMLRDGSIGLTSLAVLVQQQQPPPSGGGAESSRQPAGQAGPRRGRQVIQQDEAYQVILSYMADFSRELNDRAPLPVTTKRAYNLYTRSGLDINAFIQQLYAARAIVKERTASITSQDGATAAGPTKRKAAYYFAVLEDLLGLRVERDGPSSAPAGE
jgi:hypothetical protein